MGLPGDNVDGFTQGSPINFAHQLRGNLLVIHGTGDDNCHYQATEALINELIRHNKPFTMMAYPNRSHAVGRGKDTHAASPRVDDALLKGESSAGTYFRRSAQNGKDSIGKITEAAQVTASQVLPDHARMKVDMNDVFARKITCWTTNLP